MPDRLTEIKERWKWFRDDTWSKQDQAMTGHGVAIFGPVLNKIRVIIKRDGWAPGTAILVAAVPDTAPLVHDAIIHAPADIDYLLNLLEASDYGQDEIVQ